MESQRNTIEYVIGDLLDAQADVICHQVNCQGVMGSGLAAQIAKRYPDVKDAYLQYCKDQTDPYHMLGNVQLVNPDGAPYRVANVFGQMDYGRQKVRYTSYDALNIAFTNLNRAFKGKTLAFPHGFGCGLGGGDWAHVLLLMEQCFTDCTIKIYSREDPEAERFRVIIAGSRNFADYELLKSKCDFLFSKRKPTAILCGEARGADTLGKRYAEANQIPVLSFPADWEQYGRKAGYIRNSAMAEHADALIAFWDGQSRGTRNMIEIAQSMLIPTRVIKINQ